MMSSILVLSLPILRFWREQLLFLVLVVSLALHLHLLEEKFLRLVDRWPCGCCCGNFAVAEDDDEVLILDLALSTTISNWTKPSELLPQLLLLMKLAVWKKLLRAALLSAIHSSLSRSCIVGSAIIIKKAWKVFLVLASSKLWRFEIIPLFYGPQQFIIRSYNDSLGVMMLNNAISISMHFVGRYIIYPTADVYTGNSPVWRCEDLLRWFAVLIRNALIYAKNAIRLNDNWSSIPLHASC